jgi:hypothetical protein
MRSFRLVAAVIAWGTLALQLYLSVAGENAGAAAVSTVNDLSYFTIDSAIFAALLFTLAGLQAPILRTGVALYVATTLIIYDFVQPQVWTPMGAQLAVDLALRYVVPLLYLADWLFFVPKARLRPRHALLWLAFPFVYGAYSLIRGAITGWYPYLYLDAGHAGYGTVLMHMLFLFFAFLLGGIVLVAIGWVFGRIGDDETIHHVGPRRPHSAY